MSRVSIEELYSDFTVLRMEAREYGMNHEQYAKLAETEIVPRKMVEMIIEECERNKMTNYKYGNYCAGDNLKHIREYAESLLKQFEEDDE